MDGTLTEPRKKIDMQMCNALKKLQKANIKIGIVTGSDLNYVREQCSLFWEFSPIDPSDILFFPCNGTKFCHYENANAKVTIAHECNMKNELGILAFNKIIYKIFDAQQRMQ